MLIDQIQYKAVIFDMDGLIMDSEPLWQEAEMTVFKTIGISLTLENCLETTGLPTKDVIKYWYEKLPWLGKSVEQVEKELYEEVIRLIGFRGKTMPGVLKTLTYFKEKNIPMGLASASPMPIIEAALNKCEISTYFNIYHSGTLEKKNKPDPAIYNRVAASLNTNITDCIILEDSGNGVKGALSSGATVIAIPAPHEFGDTKFDLAHFKVENLSQLF